MRGIRRAASAAGIAMVTLASPAAAQYTAPPPDPGSVHLRRHGDRLGRVVRQVDVRRRHARARRLGQRPGPRDARHGEGAIHVGASPFGAYWYPVKPFGDAVFRIQYTVENTPTSTPNGGVMIRSPEIRYTRRDDTNARYARAEADRLQLRRLPGRDRRSAPDAPAASTTYKWAGAPGPFPPAGEYTGGYCARQTAAGVYNVNGLNGQPLTTNGNANNTSTGRRSTAAMRSRSTSR